MKHNWLTNACPARADVEDATFEHVLAQLVASLGLPALFLGPLPLLCLAVVERHPLAWRVRSVRLEGQILLGHLPAQAREDELVGVVLGDAIKVAAVPVHVGGPGHPDAQLRWFSQRKTCMEKLPGKVTVKMCLGREDCARS
eukprot:CAMPEP_0177561448 /NCGR_PEP_ID=MMETSP0369-20130122/71940_1 /TAXON_ID=447022 ORGANISM="Scrippsiella hangoei-like, Strain SHHI-4" /NCGR_SAMPLE_ID=MMETSP0369 /ASSEMBLY_ACC=CAM_ASM_000364 /LENGTH=141 /DNA_ID=CAMNT_0019048375 /DNA_START=59 /DNA_END=481 /DNA_ORIENTATION=+